MKAFDVDGKEVVMPFGIARIRMIPSDAKVMRGRKNAEQIQILEFTDSDSDCEFEVAIPKKVAEDMGEEMARTKIRVVGG